MFGVAVARLDKVTDEEKMRYQSLYCGLCRALKNRYGQVSRASLSYDLAFLVMLYNSLYEPAEDTGYSTCISHPKKKMPYSMSVWSDYAADLSVALAYHKCLDDVADENTLKAKTASKLLASSYKLAQQRIPDQCSSIEESMACIKVLENDTETSPDDAALTFGSLLGELFSKDQGIWTDALKNFGTSLGRFIYLMDAAVDFDDDKKSGSYNPFVGIDASVEVMRDILTNIIGDAARAFELLPLEQDLNLMRSVIYSGVWQKFNQKYENRGEKPS